MNGCFHFFSCMNTMLFDGVCTNIAIYLFHFHFQQPTMHVTKRSTEEIEPHLQRTNYMN